MMALETAMATKTYPPNTHHMKWLHLLAQKPNIGIFEMQM